MRNFYFACFLLISSIVGFTGCVFSFNQKKNENNSTQTVESYTDDSFTEELVSPFEANYQKISIKDESEWYFWSRTEDGIDSKIYDEEAENSEILEENSNKIVGIKHLGEEDYSINFSDRISVTPGEIYMISSNVFLSYGDIRECFILYDKDDNVLDWVGGEALIYAANGFQACYTTIYIGENVAKITPRFIGYGKTLAKIKNTSVYKLEKINSSKYVDIENDILKVSCDVNTVSVKVEDKRNGKIYNQYSDSIEGVIYADCYAENNTINFKTYNNKGKEGLKITVGFDEKDSATVNYTIEMPSESKFSSLSFPQKAVSEKDDYLVVPINEGMCFDYDDSGIYPYELVTYSGHGLCMPFFGITNKNDGAGFISIIKDPDDCAVKMETHETNCIGAVWKAQKGKFGYDRHLSQTFFTEGNHVAIAKKYREYAKEKGLLVTFDEKKAQRGEKGSENIDKLMGAVNIWSWYYDWEGHEASDLVKIIKDAGFGNILWSNGQSAEVVEKMNQMGVLTGKYDIYQDVMNPDNYELLSYVHTGDWLPEAYPQDIAIGSDGNFVQAWGVERKDNSGYIYCVALCDMTAPGYARTKIEEELNQKNFGARFFDTTTASALRECYSSVHPMTRTQSREARFELLSISSLDHQLVTGSETGMDFVVPVCDYFEGMMSLGLYRREDAGRNVDQFYDEVPSQITEYQLNEKRRLPLWELVYHDCCVAYWYWGDHNNTFNPQEIWDKRDDFNALYAVPPMYWIKDEDHFEENKERFLKSYAASSDITKRAAGVEMISHEFLNDDRSLQRTKFANGLEVTVDFSTNSISYN